MSIGKALSISKQRVQQILRQVGRDDLRHLTPERLHPRIKKICANVLCGQPFEVIPCYTHKRFCGGTCYHADRRERARERTAPLIKEILRLRDRGMTWKAIGLVVGFDGSQPGTRVLVTLSRWRALPPTTVTEGS